MNVPPCVGGKMPHLLRLVMKFQAGATQRRIRKIEKHENSFSCLPAFFILFPDSGLRFARRGLNFSHENKFSPEAFPVSRRGRPVRRLRDASH
jgi:hypothetical protein